ncbi:hypothetical protein TWF694_000345 [Orbilia ellipsospora]|uniref:Uncharacterized protein n=1 Tax=Orbilia ellipsospora TaxID=2528407 RepID=A0AAV9XUZ6_9PEZI
MADKYKEKFDSNSSPPSEFHLTDAEEYRKNFHDMPKRSSDPKETPPEAAFSSEESRTGFNSEAPSTAPKDKIPPFPWPKARTKGKFAPWGKRIVGEDSDDSVDEDRLIDPSFFRNFKLNEPCPFFTKDELKKENRINEIFGRKDKTKPYWQHVPRSGLSIPTASWTDQKELLSGKPVDFPATGAPLYKPKNISSGLGINILDLDEPDDVVAQPSQRAVTDGAKKEQVQETQLGRPNWLDSWFRRHFPPPSQWNPEAWPAVFRDIYLNIRAIREMVLEPNLKFLLLTTVCLIFGGVMVMMVGFGMIRASEIRILVENYRLD